MILPKSLSTTFQTGRTSTSAAAGPRWSSSPATPARLAASVAVSFAQLLQLQRSGEVRSRRVSRSTSASSPAITPRLVLLDAGASEKYVADAPVLNEPSRRPWAAAESTAIGDGGDPLVSLATGLARETVRKGRRGNARGEAPTGRIRANGPLNNGRFEFQVSLHAPSMARNPKDSDRICGNRPRNSIGSNASDRGRCQPLRLEASGPIGHPKGKKDVRNPDPAPG